MRLTVFRYVCAKRSEPVDVRKVQREPLIGPDSANYGSALQSGHFSRAAPSALIIT